MALGREGAVVAAELWTLSTAPAGGAVALAGLLSPGERVSRPEGST
jgi:hypothetical protein